MKLEFTLEMVAKITGGRLLRGNPGLSLVSLSTDSRKINPGELFIPLKGEKYEGHEFLSNALIAGANICLCQPEFEYRAKGFANVILVVNTLLALQAIAKTHRSQFNLRVVGLTGSCGKTMVKELTAAIVSTQFCTMASQGNINNEVGLPLQVLELLPEHQVAVLELGTNHPGELAILCEIAQPNAGIWTNVGMGHIGFFGSMEAILEEKSALVKAIPHEGTMVLNADDPLVLSTRKFSRGNVITYALDNPADYKAERLTLMSDGVSFVVQDVLVKSNLVGRHSISNILAALSLTNQWGIPLTIGAKAISSVAPLGRRLAINRLQNIVLIDDCYNSNPSSLRIALEILMQQPGKRHLAVLGDMYELGDFAAQQHRISGEVAAKLGVDKLFLLGQLASQYAVGAVSSGMKSQEVRIFASREDLINKLLQDLHDGDVVLVKASRAMEFEAVSDAVNSAWGKGF